MSRGLNRNQPRLFGKRTHLSKEGRELANAAAEQIHRTDPDCVDDPDDPTLADVLTYLKTTDTDPRQETTAALTDALGVPRFSLRRRRRIPSDPRERRSSYACVLVRQGRSSSVTVAYLGYVRHSGRSHVRNGTTG